MSNEIIDINKLMKDITDALGTRVAPLIRDIKEKRSGIPALTEKIQQKKRDIIEEQLKAENAAKAAEKEAEKGKETGSSYSEAHRSHLSVSTPVMQNSSVTAPCLEKTLPRTARGCGAGRSPSASSSSEKSAG